MSTEVKEVELPGNVLQELDEFRDWIAKFRAEGVGEVKMQKIRLQLGVYAQRQDGVQMQRIKLPGGALSANQLRALSACADKYGSGFIHWTTRQDAQLYYLQLEDAPDMMIDLAQAGITTREACGNTVRNITCCYRSGMSKSQVFDTVPYSEALFRYLVRNKFNQVMGRKMKIAFESCSEDHAGMLYHDFGFQAAIQDGKRGFKVWVAGGLGAVPILGQLFTEFLPEEDLLRFSAAAVRIFDRYGERKNRMQARMKYLAKSLGPEELNKRIQDEMKLIELDASENDWIAAAHATGGAPPLPDNLPANPEGVAASADYQQFVRDNVVPHIHDGYTGVNVRLKLGDSTCLESNQLADLADTFSQGELKITIEQNLFLPWVPESALPALYQGLVDIGLADSGAETLIDTTTCPGADTCRLGITSAKGLGARISEVFLAKPPEVREAARDIRVKISGCPNSCAQHMVAQIAFQGAATKKDGKSVPSHFLYLAGQQALDDTQIAKRIGKYPAMRCPEIVERLVDLYVDEQAENESFTDCMDRLGKDAVKAKLSPLEVIESYDEAPELFQDWGHDNEEFAVRQGVKGECAGAPVQEHTPTIQAAQEKLNQAEAFFAHQEYANAQIETYEAMAAGARVPLYTHMCDPFTAEQSLWEFENIFARSGQVDAKWVDSAQRFASVRDAEADVATAIEFIETAKEFLAECAKVDAALKGE